MKQQQLPVFLNLLLSVVHLLRFHHQFPPVLVQYIQHCLPPLHLLLILHCYRFAEFHVAFHP